jgi:hypothetical protein
MIKKDFSIQFSIILGLMMVALCFGLAIVVLFSPTFIFYLKKSRTVFAIAFIVLGVMRSVIIYQKFKKREE